MSAQTIDMKRARTAHAIRRIAAAITEAVQESPQGIPEGHLYSLLSEFGCTLEQFNALIAALVEIGKVKRGPNHLLLPA